ncbi:MAG: putative maltokinase, partial [Byssovorax sp.]
DNIYLGDRDGVRTPMQWSSDRNAGFSRANPQKLYLPPVTDPEFHYEAINVEAQQQNPSSLLWWTKRLLAKRKEHKVFGRGSIDFPHANNARVLVFVREHEGESLLVVANLSRFAQCVEIELGRFQGTVPREVFGRARFPTIGAAPYLLSMAPHSIFWFFLEQPATAVAAHYKPPTLAAVKTWRSLFEASLRGELARVLLGYMVERRWFRGKARGRKGARVVDVLGLDGNGAGAAHAVVLLAIDYEEGSPETYVLPVSFADASEDVAATAIIARVTVSDARQGAAGGGPTEGVLYDALIGARFAETLLQTMRTRRNLGGERGQIVGIPFGPLQRVSPEANLAPRPGTAEQSNSSVVYGDSFILKVLRSIDEGPDPELEIARFLKETSFRSCARIAGALEYRRPGGEPSSVGVLFEHVANQGDAWQLTLDSLDRFFDRALSAEGAASPTPLAGSLVQRAGLATSPVIREMIGPYLDRVRLLGVRTAELHLALASNPKDPEFAPEPFDTMYQQSIYQAAHNLAARTWRVLKQHQKQQPQQSALIDRLVAAEAEVDTAIMKVSTRKISVDRTRVHGDYHLGQVLWTGEDFVIIDFGGEPGRPLSHRRFKRCPLRDVAGMIRSFDYAVAAALRSGRPRQEDLAALEPWTQVWTARVSAEFLGGYLEKASGASFVPRSAEDVSTLLDFYLLEKCIYEVAYELNNRPDWLDIPTRGLFALLEPKS